MGGGLLQLVAYGAQDAYLSGNPQITFWRGLYKRHTNFAMEPFRVNLTGQANWGVKHSAILPRHADLVFNTYLEVELPDYGLARQPVAPSSGNEYYGWAKDLLGFKLIKYVELDIGGQVIDRLYGEWLAIWSSLSLTSDAQVKLSKMVSLPDYTTTSANCNGFASNKLYVPLFFFFTRSPGAALPLIALQYHEVKINIVWNTSEYVTENYKKTYSGGLYPNTTIQPPAPQAPRQANLLVDYIYLDVEERRRMAQESHEYLIEQTQFNEDKGVSAYSSRVDLTFNHPVKELVWVGQPTAFTNCKYTDTTETKANTSPHAVGDTVFDYSLTDTTLNRYSLQINGQDRVPLLEATYFTRVQPYQHHSGTNGLGVACYSFAIRPEEHQPSGTCNFSRIDTATLVVNSGAVRDLANDDLTGDIRVYAVNYNVLRVMSGMAGLAYSN